MQKRFVTDPRENERGSRLLDDGRYMYRCWNPYDHRYECTVLAADEVSEEVIAALAEMDDMERRSDRRYDDFFVTMDAAVGVTPMRDESAEPEHLLFDEPEPVSKEIRELQEAIEQLTPAQIDLIRDLFALQLTQVEIAERDGVSKQAVQNRKNKIVNRLAHLMLENEAFS